VALLGSGSNLLVADAGFDGLVIRIGLRGIEHRPAGDLVRGTAAAGEIWDELVSMAVDRGWAGIECLAGIPGTVGATPIQNVGAYGQELAGTLHSVRVLDRNTMRETTLPRDACRLGYRSSRFRRERNRFVVLAVTLELRPGGEPELRYPELVRAVAAGSRPPDLATVREVVLELRRSKSMVIDDRDPNHRSAGSFFVNPVLTPAQAQELAARAVAIGAIDDAAALPRYPAEDGQVKIPAAWLIEAAGFSKGLRRGPVGLSSRHVLALVHHGGGTARQLIDLALEIRGTVHDRLGVLLEPEPLLLGPPEPRLWPRG
jgi:UDP-N-acetylmuramate dehydrogenase